jgi:hypothetical protein
MGTDGVLNVIGGADASRRILTWGRISLRQKIDGKKIWGRIIIIIFLPSIFLPASDPIFLSFPSDDQRTENNTPVVTRRQFTSRLWQYWGSRIVRER